MSACWSLQARIQQVWTAARFDPVDCIVPPLILYRVQQNQPIVYRSPLMQQLQRETWERDRASRHRFTAQLLTAFTTQRDWHLQVNAQERIEFVWSESGLQRFWLALWVAAWPPWLPTAHGTALLPPTPDLLQVQYTHGRCLSLLALAQRTKVLDLEGAPPQLEWSMLQGEGDRALLAAWIDCSDRLDQTEGRDQIVRLALVRLSEAWLHWYRHHRIWGDVLRENRALAQARIGITALTAHLFRWGLRDRLRLEPWRSL